MTAKIIKVNGQRTTDNGFFLSWKRKVENWKLVIGWETHKCQEDWSGGALEKADGSLEHNFVGYVDTMLEYYLHVDPSKLTDEEWAEKFKQLADIRKREGKMGW